MDYVENTFEREDRLKGLWKKYGNIVTTAILIIMALIVGSQYWHKHQAKVADQASIGYENLLSSVISKKDTQVADLANQLMSEYSGSVYAKLAGLVYAKQAIANNKLILAEQKLQWVVDKANSDSIKAIAQIRLARVLISDVKPHQALTVLNKVTEKEFLAQANMVKGDAYYAMKDIKAAKVSYQQALTMAVKNTPLYAYIQMKLYSI